jgi:hypothetical protein
MFKFLKLSFIYNYIKICYKFRLKKVMSNSYQELSGDDPKVSLQQTKGGYNTNINDSMVDDKERTSQKIKKRTSQYL